MTKEEYLALLNRRKTALGLGREKTEKWKAEFERINRTLCDAFFSMLERELCSDQGEMTALFFDRPVLFEMFAAGVKEADEAVVRAAIACCREEIEKRKERSGGNRIHE